ncbi:hypothetical protein Zmor_023177 [Zophobas morio]|uniref:Uncharacterized protein n=2 Tax=Zophobas morio TaxID=2755281 RepID=A0AA38HYC6_9CUCU|nr:hypothetical protein Zmor_023177 [Zophobas morio]
MATYNNFPEEGRPPDSPSNRKYKDRKHFQPRNNSWSHPNSLIYPNGPDNIVNNNLLGLDINRNGHDSNKKSHSLKNKLFCIKKPLEENKRKSLNILNVNALSDNCTSASKSVCDNNPSCSTGKDRNRNAFHQDVEEALSSLLWQPYEYQNKRKPPSSCSSCGSSGTFSDLDDPPNKGPLRSNTTDLNLRTEMVNNLKPAHQCRSGNQSRDPLSCYATSRLNSQASLVESLESGTATCVGDSASDCDVFPHKNSDMQLEVSGTESTISTAPNVLNIPTGNDGLIRNQNVTLLNGTVRPNSLSSANVVGLPENPRRASVPSTTQLRPNVVFPNHPRNGSEPSQRYNQNVVPVVHQRNNSQVDQTTITHLRSASVPKQMTGIAPNHQRMNSDGKKVAPLNVSNVNVNFYRAVPVNVVSSVPTIQCLNTLDQGNNVSNVQIMPLGTTQPPFSSAAVTGTTQVTVHNTPAPTHTVSVVPNRNPAPRTFTSTEAQTDEISVCPPPAVPDTAATREQRRKERRERRHQRRSNGASHRHTVDSGTQANTLPQNSSQNDRLPDLLNSHMPPPYSPLPSNVPPPNVVLPSPMMVPPPHHPMQSVVPNNVVPSGLVAFPPPQVVGGQVPLVQGSGPVAVPVPPPSGFRFPFPAGGFRR